MVKSGLVPLAGDSEEREEHTGRRPPWGVSREGRELGAWPWRPPQGDEPPPAGCRTTGSDRKGVGSPNSTREARRHAGSPWRVDTGPLFPCHRASRATLGTRPCLKQVNALGLLAPNHSMAMNPWGPQPGRRLDLGTRGYPLPGQRLGGVTVALTGTYSSSSVKWPEPLTAAAPPRLTPRYTRRIHTSPACPAAWLHNRERAAEAAGSGPL